MKSTEGMKNEDEVVRGWGGDGAGLGWREVEGD